MVRFFLLVAALGLACTPLPQPTPPTPVEGADAAAPPAPEDACRRSYEHLVIIHCTPREPSVGTWVDVCRNARKHGAFRLDGIDRARSEDEARRAGVDCVPTP